MAQCPKCGSRIAFRELMRETSLVGVVCGRCDASLEMTPLSRTVLFLTATALGIAAGHSVRDYGWPISFLATASGIVITVLLFSLAAKYREMKDLSSISTDPDE